MKILLISFMFIVVIFTAIFIFYNEIQVIYTPLGKKLNKELYIEYIRLPVKNKNFSSGAIELVCYKEKNRN